MNENDEYLKKVFNEAELEDYLDKRTLCAGLGIKKTLLDSKAIHGGGPPYIKDSTKEANKLYYKKIDAIEWCIQYSAELASKKAKLKAAVFSMSKQRQGNW